MYIEDDTVINIQLPYDPNVPMEPELWDGNFHSISLYRSIKHIASVSWQPLITKTNDYTSSKSLKLDIKWEVHKRTQQGVSAKLESYLYKTCLVCATNN